MANKKEKSTTIRLDPQLFDKATKRAESLDRSFASYIRHLVLKDLGEKAE